MKFISVSDKLIHKVIYLLILIFVIFQNNVSVLNASIMNQYKELSITEELRLNVPAKYKNVWLKAEKKIWEPWLAKQEGFLGRQIFYNEKKEEALLLVNWESKNLWKKISIEEVNKIQDLFEENVKDDLKLSKYPFEFIYEGELLNQK
ncbi:MAG: TIGR03792 family protein [Prochlorococcus sp. SP3034]|nr:TIGR03792 family protein [Prochlorococcus sp. SP3034]|tara:strand:+ start:8635 stop:9078 length:444 start_codon:yes stop_codon:yes gene_type:complete